MSERPVFVATHPRACSTAFERVFMTRRDTLQCAHEPFGDAFYYGPERLGERYADDEAGRLSSGFSKTTYQDVLDRLDRDGNELANGHHANDVNGVNGHGHTNGLNGHSHTNGVNGIDKSKRQGSDPTGNPTVIPLEFLQKFHWTFLIRHPRRGIPSYVRCCSPPLCETTGWDHFMPSEAGYVELRRLFDYLREQGLVGPSVADRANGAKKGKDEISITVLDADDLLDKPEEAIRAFCKQTDIPFSPDMLKWGDEANQKQVADAFAKWNGWHNDAINSKGLTARTHSKKPVTEESENEEWRQKYGEEGQKIIRACVEENTPHYEYLKSFALEF
ncbi:hypothetical protein E0Z10_g2633 [Xylaria hypoxylon]|uniref:P-loop containing nucleoside triphosphate hydrolase protein n=1 Tax=Xylaria hypoxylon TaxID=37992 RepID=A0A4Z0YQF6_9PEZI|nr:hypothetical protein E0Z10_g2633 [Xylaria hypoxylon]